MYLNQLQISISLNTIPPYVHQEILKWKTVTEKS